MGTQEAGGQAFCSSPTKQILSGGWFAPPGVQVTKSYPAGGQSWVVWFVNTTSSAQNVYVYGICADAN